MSDRTRDDNELLPGRVLSTVEDPEPWSARTDRYLDVAPHPGRNHEFRTTCLRCGEPGRLHISLITPDEVVHVESAAALRTREPAGEPPA